MIVKPRMLITGASGMLGGTLVKYFAADYEVYATSGQPDLPFATRHLQFDLNSATYEKLISWSQPDVIIHSAALTNGNQCDQNPALALQTNALSLHKLGLSIDSKTRILYISTDAVFPGEAHNSTEKDFTASESVYGKSKELGEFFLALRSQNFTIIRTTIVGVNQLLGRQGFAEWIVNSAKKEERIVLFEDVLFTPISCSSLAQKLSVILDQNLFLNEKVHIGASEVYSKYDFGIALLEELDLNTENVDRGRITDFADRAKRATDQSLDSSFFEETTGIKLPGLKETVKQLKEDFYE